MYVQLRFCFFIVIFLLDKKKCLKIEFVLYLLYVKFNCICKYLHNNILNKLFFTEFSKL